MVHIVEVWQNPPIFEPSAAGGRLPVRPGLHPDARALRALRALTPERDGVDGAKLYLYGEGWDHGEVGQGSGYLVATEATNEAPRCCAFFAAVVTVNRVGLHITCAATQLVLSQNVGSRCLL